MRRMEGKGTRRKRRLKGKAGKEGLDRIRIHGRGRKRKEKREWKSKKME